MCDRCRQENKRLHREIRQLNHRVENLLEMLKRQSIEIGEQQDLIRYAQAVISRCSDCFQQWQQELLE